MIGLGSPPAQGGSPWPITLPAEGLGRSSSPEKACFFIIARGFATVCAASVDVLRVRALAAPALCESARLLLVRITQMLSKLISRHRG